MILKEWEKIVIEQKRFTDTCAVLGGLLKEHPELKGCIETIAYHILEKIKKNEEILEKVEIHDRNVRCKER